MPKTKKLENEVKTKEFNLSKEEKTLLDNQNNMRSQYDYVSALIVRDMYIYVNTSVRKRLNIGEDMMITYDLQTGKVYANPKPPKPVDGLPVEAASFEIK